MPLTFNVLNSMFQMVIYFEGKYQTKMIRHCDWPFCIGLSIVKPVLWYRLVKNPFFKSLFFVKKLICLRKIIISIKATPQGLDMIKRNMTG